MKWWQISKAVLYFSVAVLIFTFNQKIMPYVGYIVGAVVCIYAVEGLAVSAVKGTLISDKYHLFDGLVQVLIGIILFLVVEDIIKVCLVWGLWSIIRESREMAESIESIRKKRIGFINLIESVVIIVMAVLMIMEPGERQAHRHMILLGIELITVVVFALMETLIYKARRSAYAEDETDDIVI